MADAVRNKEGRNESAYLHGVRVLELADETGEYAGRVLAGLGADIVKVEPPEGETNRGDILPTGTSPSSDCDRPIRD
jgi:crotonobetainyl-CoA:carnitine CoA-transferase CaiB-like acyl-CoA transferase